jgi:hypothetical protein
MKTKYMSLIAAIAAAIAAQGVFVQLAAAAEGQKFECYDAAAMPKAKSDKSRASVKAEISGKEFSCYDEATEPKAKSAKNRAAVKAEAKAAMKAGEIPQGEASQMPAPKK